MTKKITTFFTDSGTPKTGLSATIRIRDLSSNSLVITDASMVEVGDGFYSYSFTTYDELKSYSIRCDGSATLTSDSERYTYACNESYEEDLSRVITAGGVLVGQHGQNGGHVLTEEELKAFAKEIWRVMLTKNNTAAEVLLSRSDFNAAKDKVFLVNEIKDPLNYTNEMLAIVSTIESVSNKIDIIGKKETTVNVSVPDALMKGISSILSNVKSMSSSFAEMVDHAQGQFTLSGSELQQKIDSLASQIADTKLDLACLGELPDALSALKDSLANLRILAGRLGGGHQIMKSTLIKLTDLKFRNLQSNLIRK